MIRHMKFPKTLYRLQNTLRFRMKQGTKALEQGKTNFDYLVNEHGLYLPRTQIQTEKVEFRPNGVQLYSMDKKFQEMLKRSLKESHRAPRYYYSMESVPRYYYVVEIPQGTEVPESTVLLQDPVKSFVYWLETQVTVEPKQFNSRIELLLLGSKIHRKKQFKAIFINDLKPKIKTSTQQTTIKDS